jgi:hypothetical protein
MHKVITAKDIGAAFAAQMRDFGYPDVTDAQGLECYEAFKAGKTDDMPHGIVGQFAVKQFGELKERADEAGRVLP